MTDSPWNYIDSVHLTIKKYYLISCHIVIVINRLSESNFTFWLIEQILKPVGNKGVFVTLLCNFIGDDSVLGVIFKQVDCTGIVYGGH